MIWVNDMEKKRRGDLKEGETIAKHFLLFPNFLVCDFAGSISNMLIVFIEI